MKRYNIAQLKTFTTFYVNLAVAWFAGTGITALTSNISFNEKIILTTTGLFGAYLALSIALDVAKRIR